MRYFAFLLIIANGCVATSQQSLSGTFVADMIGEIAVRYAIKRTGDDTPVVPQPPREGCVDGCTCNGTGKEKTGDGLDTVECRCPDGCKCKPATKQAEPEKPQEPAKEPVATKQDDPPMVPVPRSVPRSGGRIECRGGTCYWVEEGTGKRYRIVR